MRRLWRLAWPRLSVQRTWNPALGATVQWWKGDLSWKAAYEVEVVIALAWYRIEFEFFILHRLSARDRSAIISAQRRLRARGE